jgi:hypothetical protein
MIKVLLDPSVRAKLHNLDGELELCDETGRTLGHFLPADRYVDLLYDRARTEFGNEKELEEARREVRAVGGFTTAEAIAHLESVARSARGGS